MTGLVITRGLPASGKTTWAKEWASQHGHVRLSRDDMRANLFGVEGVGTAQQEAAITDLMHRSARAHLDNGINVVIDATNLRLRHAREYATIAHKAGAEFEVKDFDADVETCVARDLARAQAGGRYVGEAVIRDMARRFRDRPEVTPRTKAGEFDVEPYIPDTTLPPAIIVDIDGTLAHMTGRSPYDWEKVGEDALDENLARIVEILRYRLRVIIVSGRSSEGREITERWLADNGVRYDELYMRPANDSRADTIVKNEIFDAHIRNRFNVVCVFDDRNCVVDYWRRVGLSCYQVAPGDF